MQDPAYEAIGDYRFSKWKTEPKPEELPRFSIGFFQIVIVLVAVVLVTGKLAVDEVRAGNFLIGQIWLCAFMAIYIVPLLVVPFLRNRRREKVTPLEAPAHLPSHAIHVRVLLRGQNGTRGSSLGWLWVDGEWLRFSGEGFDFKLRPSDFKMRGNLAKAILRGWVYIVTPKKISASAPYITPCRRVDDKLLATPEAWHRLAPALEQWVQAPQSLEPSLYPPLRRNIAPFDMKPFWRAALITALGGTVLGLLVVVLFAKYLPQNPVGIVVATAGLGLLMVATYPLQVLSNKTFDKEVDRAQAR